MLYILYYIIFYTRIIFIFYYLLSTIINYLDNDYSLKETCQFRSFVHKYLLIHFNYIIKQFLDFGFFLIIINLFEITIPIVCSLYKVRYKLHMGVLLFGWTNVFIIHKNCWNILLMIYLFIFWILFSQIIYVLFYFSENKLDNTKYNTSATVPRSSGCIVFII